MMVSRAQWLAAVESCIGTPVVHGGRAPGRALDCVGVVIASLRLCGIEIPEPKRYRRRPTAAELYAGMEQHFARVHGLPAFADAHVLQVLADGEARHVVVPVSRNAAGQTIVVHAWGKHCLVHRAILVDQVAQAWRHPEVE